MYKFIKSILEKKTEKLANIDSWLGNISDLIMVMLIANHNCTSISFEVAEYDVEQKKEINKYKRSINKRNENTFRINKNKILINSEDINKVKPFIKTRIISAIPPPAYDYDSGNDFYKRFFSNESYPEQILKLFDYFTEQIFNLKLLCPNIYQQVQTYKFRNFILFHNRRAWQKIFSGLVFDKLHSGCIVTDYFTNSEEVISNLSLFNINEKDYSLIEFKDNELKISKAYQNNKLVLLPYLMIWVTNYSTNKLKNDLLYSSFI